MVAGPRARWVPALVAAGVLAVAGCSGGSDDSQRNGSHRNAASAPVPATTVAPAGAAGDAARIAELARYVVLTPAADVCRDKFSAKFVKRVFGSVATCDHARGGGEGAHKGLSDDPVDAEVTDVRVAGPAATATVTEYRRDGDSAGGTWAFIRAGDEWRVAAWGVDYLRAGVRASFGPNYQPESPDDLLGNATTRACVAGWFERRHDSTFTRLAHRLLRSDKSAPRQVRDQVLSCASAPGADGVSALRGRFEDHLRKDAAAKGQPEITGCLVRRTRAGITDAHLARIERAGRAPAWLDRRLGDIGLDCALARVRS